MKPAPFEYHAPTTVDDALAILADLGDDAKVLAGGQSLVPMLNLRLARFDHLVDIGRIDELRGIGRANGSLRVGAGTRDSVIEFDPTVAADVPLLAAVTPYIGHYQIRNRGTIGGSLVHADPAAEYPAVAVALDATFDVVSTRGAGRIPAADFFTGVWSTAAGHRRAAQVRRVPRVERPVRVRRRRVRQAPRRLRDRRRRGGGRARPGDVVARSAIAVFGVSGTPIRATATEAALSGRAVSEIDPGEVGPMVFDAIDEVADDPQVPADYRRRVGTAMACDAWQRAVDDAMATIDDEERSAR